MKQFVSTTLAASLALCAGFASAQPFPAVPPATDGTAHSMENFNYGVCRGTDPSCYHNWGVTRQKKVLLFTRTAGPRHASLGTALPAGLNPTLGANNRTQADIIRLLKAEGIDVDYTETVTRLTNLNQYMAVVFFSNSRDVLFDHGRAVDPAFAVSTTTSAYLDQSKVLLRQYMRAGGGFVAVHNAFGTEYNWPWYEGLLGNANYYDHGANQAAKMEVVAADSSTTPIGPPGTRVTFTDEWYNLVPFPTNVKFLMTVDESTMATKRSTHPGFPAFHPVSWCQYYDGGRVWATTLGHDARATADLSLPENKTGGTGFFEGADAFQKHLVNGIKSAMGLQPFCETYRFSGFGDGAATAGSAVNVNFSVAGNKSTNPVVWMKTAQASCATGLPTSDYTAVTTTLDPGSVLASVVNQRGGSSVSGDGTNFHFNWLTDRSWAGTCRQIMMLVNDGTIHTAVYQF
jgi:type 1 glutamine amidotransferase